MIHNLSMRRQGRFSEMTVIENEREHSKISEKHNDYISETDSNMSNHILGNNSFKDEFRNNSFKREDLENNVFQEDI